MTFDSDVFINSPPREMIGKNPPVAISTKDSAVRVYVSPMRPETRDKVFDVEVDLARFSKSPHDVAPPVFRTFVGEDNSCDFDEINHQVVAASLAARRLLNKHSA